MTAQQSLFFFGTGPVAATSLAHLVTKFDIERVITKRAPNHHHGSVPVLELAQQLDLPVNFANTDVELRSLITLPAYKSHLGVVVDYGVIVSQEIIETFPLGIINSHFSLLPEWRGADPITFTVLSGQIETGVSLMLLAEKLDEGQLIAQERVPVPVDVTTPELTDKLVQKSSGMLLHYLPSYISGNLQPYDQPDIPATYSRKLEKKDGIIDWAKPAVRLEREIRAFIGWPKSRTTLASKDIVITKAHVVESSGIKPGRVIASNKALVVACGEQALSLDRLKPAGKPEMTIEAFLAGYGHLL